MQNAVGRMPTAAGKLPAIPKTMIKVELLRQMPRQRLHATGNSAIFVLSRFWITLFATFLFTVLFTSVALM